MAAGLYLLLMWGYLALPAAQWFAVFLALVMSAMVVFWVSDATADNCRTARRQELGLGTQDAEDQLTPDTEPSLEAAILRLDSLKAELTLQYAQFGRDQSLINSNGLGSWHHGNRTHGAR